MLHSLFSGRELHPLYSKSEMKVDKPKKLIPNTSR